MVVFRAMVVPNEAFYFCGSSAAFDWSRNPADAAQYPDEAAARADLVGSPMAYTHYAMRAQPLVT